VTNDLGGAPNDGLPEIVLLGRGFGQQVRQVVATGGNIGRATRVRFICFRVSRNAVSAAAVMS
jgi:hypothetical protein